MFRFRMMSKWVRSTKIIYPVTFDALHMVFAGAGQLDIGAQKQTQLPDCIIEFLWIITTIYIVDCNQNEEEEERRKIRRKSFLLGGTEQEEKKKNRRKYLCNIDEAIIFRCEQTRLLSGKSMA